MQGITPYVVVFLQSPVLCCNECMRTRRLGFEKKSSMPENKCDVFDSRERVEKHGITSHTGQRYREIGTADHEEAATCLHRG